MGERSQAPHSSGGLVRERSLYSEVKRVAPAPPQDDKGRTFGNFAAQSFVSEAELTIVVE